MKKYDFEDAVLFVLLVGLVLVVGYIISIPIWIAIDENNPTYLWMYLAYVVAICIAYLIKRSV
ncbi:MAG: hypothetical protein II269_00480 [Bacteroidaceae bacterium]|nr:hypothetical protein [Bacteroidaceae bacterium]